MKKLFDANCDEKWYRKKNAARADQGGAVPAAGLPLRMSMGAKKFYSILNESLFFLSQVKIRFNGIAVPGMQTGFLDSQHRWSWIIGLAANIPYTDVKGIGDGG